MRAAAAYGTALKNTSEVLRRAYREGQALEAGETENWLKLEIRQIGAEKGHDIRRQAREFDTNVEDKSKDAGINDIVEEDHDSRGEEAQ